MAEKSGRFLSQLIDTPRKYDKEIWRKAVNSCHNPDVIDPSTINVLIYDAYSEKNKFSSRSTWVQRNCNRPYIFMDWQRSLNYDFVSFILKDSELIARYIGDSPRLLKNRRK